MKQTREHKNWKDESGNLVPYNRLKPGEKQRERVSHSLLKDAKQISEQLINFKKSMTKVCQEVHDQFMKDSAVEGKGKGNFTWYNFDRTIKVEVSISDRIEFDELGIKAAKEEFDLFLNHELGDKGEALRAMINDAFTTTRKGQLDTKKVLNLTRYKQREKNEHFLKAIDLLEASIRKPSSKTYFRISEKKEDGSYQIVPLDFAAV